MRCRNESSTMFVTNTGLRQRCVLSPSLFASLLDNAIEEVGKRTTLYVIGYRNMARVNVTELCHTDDMIIFGECEQAFQHNVKCFKEELGKINISILMQEKQKQW